MPKTYTPEECAFLEAYRALCHAHQLEIVVLGFDADTMIDRYEGGPLNIVANLHDPFMSNADA